MGNQVLVCHNVLVCLGLGDRIGKNKQLITAGGWEFGNGVEKDRNPLTGIYLGINAGLCALDWQWCDVHNNHGLVGYLPYKEAHNLTQRDEEKYIIIFLQIGLDP